MHCAIDNTVLPWRGGALWNESGIENCRPSLELWRTTRFSFNFVELLEVK